MQIRKAKEIQRAINLFQSEMDLLSRVAIQEQHKDSFETYEAQYETLKQNVAKRISALEQKRRWSLYMCGGAAIIGIVAIFLGVLLIIPNTQSGE
jgi:Tfp pilus assembly protein PilN